MTSSSSEDVQIAGMRIALQYFLDLQRRLFIPRRMFGVPTASPTRTPEGTGIIAPYSALTTAAATRPGSKPGCACGPSPQTRSRSPVPQDTGVISGRRDQNLSETIADLSSRRQR